MSTPVLARSRYRIDGMDCAACAAKITTAVRGVPGVAEVSVSVTAGTMIVEHAAGVLPDAAVTRRVGALGGYRATPIAGGEAAAPVPAGDACCGHDEARDHHHHDHRHHHHGGHDHHDHAHDHGAGHEHAHGADDRAAPRERWWWSPKSRLTLASSLAVAAAWLLAWAWPAYEPWLFGAAVLVGLVPIARRAVASARFGSPFTIESLMTVAAVGALAIGAAEEAAVVVVLFLVGEMLEGAAAERARAGIRGLAALVPKTGLVERAGGVAEIPAERILPGAILLVRPGDRIAADGDIVAGESAVDEAPVTGESMPKRKAPGDAVFAGTINTDAVLRVRVTAAAADNTIARVIRLVEEAQEAKAPTERFINRFAARYTPAVVVLAALVAVVPPLFLGAPWDEWIYKGLAILLIGCPCALVISTPAAIAAALSAGARRGLLVKGGAVLEALGRIDTMALDKTGTLTTGRPVVTDVVAEDGAEKRLLSLAAALEAGSSHPLARAILERAHADAAPIPPAVEVAAIGGKGVAGRVGGARIFLGSPAAAAERAAIPADLMARIDTMNAEGKSVSVLLIDDRVAGAIAMRDEPRPDARQGIAALVDAGIAPVMLTGDNRRTAEAVGAALGIEVRAELLPEDKQRIVRELQAAGRRVGKVGDGINDAPALAAADVGIAMGGGTDVALETADAAVLHGRVLDLARLVDLARRTLANIRQNIAIALGLKAVFLVTTIVGVTGLWPAILADTGATVLVTVNALRLLAWRGKA